jgi:UDP-N-acetylmuramoyl-L-alanyl-D-glutamate--2,6-diaminopimelate ligase
MHRLGQRSAYIGTLGSGITELQYTGGMTTPACIELHGLLDDFEQAGSTTVALEVSSHGIEQRRVNGVHFDAALFTNLSRDHIDYHGDMTAYFETKVRLFTENDLEHRVICIDDEYGQALANRCGPNVVTVSTDATARIGGHPFVCVQRVAANEHGSQVYVHTSWGDGEFNLPLPGDFNVANAVLVLALLLRWDVALADACRVLGEVAAPPGRMQRVEHAALPVVLVDFAHTPASLEAVLKALRPHCCADLWCVFGCGGDRDHGKRQQMGAVVARLADHAVVTNDNPRSEVPGEIIAEILRAMPEDATAIEDRAAAISYAIATAGDEDLVLIAGKGHEDYQIIGEQRLPFSDYTTAQANLSARQARSAARR